MAEIRLTDEQQQQIGNLVMALGQDAALRDRFQADVGAVFNEYGLADLLPSDVQFEARLSEPEVSGFAQVVIGSHIDQHIDFAHIDVAYMGGFQILPRIGPPR